MTRWECFKEVLHWLRLVLAPSRIRKARTGKATRSAASIVYWTDMPPKKGGDK